MKAGFALVALLLGAWVMPAVAEAPNCHGIADHNERLDCRIKARRGYGTGLERSFHERGVDARVFVEEAGDPNSGAYPRLVIWTLLSGDRAYDLNSEAKILESARTAGFRMIVYVDKGEENNLYFDLTRPGRTALDVVPFQTPPWKR